VTSLYGKTTPVLTVSILGGPTAANSHAHNADNNQTTNTLMLKNYSQQTDMYCTVIMLDNN